jgi:hypothetical protein
MLIELLSAIVLLFSIPLLLKIRDYIYKKQNLKVGWYEDIIFLFGLLSFLLAHSMITGSEFTACLTIAPFTYINFKLYKYFWKKF